MVRPAAMFKENVLDALCGVGDVESVTVTVTVLVPAAVGVPVICPELALIVSPAGNPAAPHVYGVAPPAAATVAVYAAPTAPAGKSVVMMVKPGGFTRSANAFVAVFAGIEESVTVNVTLLVPAAVGVPVICPVPALIVKPAGNPAACQLYGPVPPATASAALYALPTPPSGNDAVVIVICPTTVTVAVTSGMFTPLARIVAVPTPTDVTGITIDGVVLPSQMNTPVGCIVATEGLLELRFTNTPSIDGIAFSRRYRSPCAPTPTIVSVGVTQVSVAFTFTVNGVAAVYAAAVAVIVAAPTFTAVNCGCAAGCVAPAGMVTEVGVTVSLCVSLLARFTVVPPAGAGLDKVTVSVPVWLSTIVAGPERLIVPGGSTVTVAVTSWVTGDVRRMTVVPGATAVTGKLSELHPAFMTMLELTVATDGFVEVAVKVMPPAGAGAERVNPSNRSSPGAGMVRLEGDRVTP